MALHVPKSDDPRMVRNFTAACDDAVRSASRQIRKINLEREVIRKLRSTLPPSITTREALDKALQVVIGGIAQNVALDNARKNVRYAYIRDWLLHQEPEEENEFNVEVSVALSSTGFKVLGATEAKEETQHRSPTNDAVQGDAQVASGRNGFKHREGDGSSGKAWRAEAPHRVEDELVLRLELWADTGDELMTPSDMAELISYGVKSEARAVVVLPPASNCKHNVNS
ncbi:hypothetical protein P43SY_008383 [Pythium insidiosum]|uniref:Uncharacterized protein n=1 Tax=Pythium insidiosum TaxID=114742 RepID=A0AAD5Q6H6_PYTIN|nr:hypothetical protein P43SY_008383 [Pythium insidiosum]